MDSLAFTIAITIGYIGIVGCLNLISSNLLNLKYTKKATTIICSVIIVLLSCIKITGLSTFKTLIVLLLYFSIVIFCYKGTSLQKSFVILSFSVFTFISELFSTNLIKLFIEINNNSFQESNKFFFAILLSNIILFVLTKLFIYFYNLFKIKNLPKTTWVILILPITTLVLILNIQEYFYISRSNSIMIFTIIGLTISNFAIAYYFYKAISSVYYKNQLEIIKIEENHLKKKYELLENHYNHNFKFSHDIFKKNILLKKYLDDKNYSSLKKEIIELIEISFKQFNSIYSNYTVVNSLLNENIDILNQNGIIFQTTIKHNNFSFLKNFDEYQLFDYLIKLGINCALHSKDEKLILLKTEKKGNQIIIKMNFPKSNIEEKDNIISKIIELAKKYKSVYSLHKDFTNKYESILIIFYED